jgi:hypothetical protein
MRTFTMHSESNGFVCSCTAHIITSYYEVEGKIKNTRKKEIIQIPLVQAWIPCKNEWMEIENPFGQVPGAMYCYGYNFINCHVNRSCEDVKT